MSKQVNIIDDSLPEHFKSASELLLLLADSVRQQIIFLFYRKQEMNVTEIASNLQVSRPTVSHHLNLMKRGNVLVSRKEGKEVFYSFNKNFVQKKIEELLTLLKGCC